MPRTKKVSPGFEELLQELEETVSLLEQGRLNLEQMLEKYAAGVELLRACRSILQQAEQLLPPEAEEGGAWS